MTFDIKSFLTNEHTRVGAAFVLAFLGYTFPQYQVLCNMLAGFLGVSAGVTVVKGAFGNTTSGTGATPKV